MTDLITIITSEKLFDKAFDKIENALHYTPLVIANETLKDGFVKVTFKAHDNKEYDIIKKYTGKSD